MFQKYLKTQKKILEEEQFAEELRIKQIYEDYSVEKLLEAGYILKFNKKDIKNFSENKKKKNKKDIKNFSENKIGLYFDENLVMLNKMREGEIIRVMILSIPDWLDISSSNLVIDFYEKNICVNFYNFRIKEDEIIKLEKIFRVDFEKKMRFKNENENFSDFEDEKKNEDYDSFFFFELYMNFRDIKNLSDKDFLIIPFPFNNNIDKIINKLSKIKREDNIFKKDQNSEIKKKNILLLKKLTCKIPLDFERRKEKYKFVNKKLNLNQKKIISDSLNNKLFYFIHGPPGTGKTTILCEILRLLSFSEKRILLLAPTNIAVDNLILNVKKFEDDFFNKLRDLKEELECLIKKIIYVKVLEEKLLFFEKTIKNEKRIDAIRKDLDILEKEKDEKKKNLENLEKKIKNLEKLYPKKLRITRIGNINKISKQKEVFDTTLEKIKLQIIEKSSEKKIINKELIKSDIIATTIDSTYTNRDYNSFIKKYEKSKIFKKRQIFDLAIIDEAGKSMNFPNLGALTNCEKVIFSGDHLQLPPTIISEENREHKSLFEENILKFEKIKNSENFIGVLNTQYRMDNHIMELSADYFYPNLKSDLKNHKNNYEKDVAILFIDTKYSNFNEEKNERRKDIPNIISKFNKGEAMLTFITFKEQKRRHNIKKEDIGIIAPYLSQVVLIKKIFKQNIKYNQIPEISTVDSFQGREKKIIIFCFVRSNAMKNIGFLGEKRRINVSITRAMKKLILIGDSNTLKEDPFIRFVLNKIDGKDNKSCGSNFGNSGGVEVRDSFSYYNYNFRGLKSNWDRNVLKIFGNNISKKKTNRILCENEKRRLKEMKNKIKVDEKIKREIEKVDESINEKYFVKKKVGKKEVDIIEDDKIEDLKDKNIFVIANDDLEKRKIKEIVKKIEERKMRNKEEKEMRNKEEKKLRKNLEKKIMELEEEKRLELEEIKRKELEEFKRKKLEQEKQRKKLEQEKQRKKLEKKINKPNKISKKEKKKRYNQRKKEKKILEDRIKRKEEQLEKWKKEQCLKYDKEDHIFFEKRFKIEMEYCIDYYKKLIEHDNKALKKENLYNEEYRILIGKKDQLLILHKKNINELKEKTIKIYFENEKKRRIEIQKKTNEFEIIDKQANLKKNNFILLIEARKICEIYIKKLEYDNKIDFLLGICSEKYKIFEEQKILLIKNCEEFDKRTGFKKKKKR